LKFHRKNLFSNFQNLSKQIFNMGSFHVNQAKIKQKCYPRSRISKLIFFVDSSSISKKNLIQRFSLKRLLFGLDQFELYDYFLAKKGSNLQYGPQKCQDMRLCIKKTLFNVIFFKFSIFYGFEEIGIHLHPDFWT
jgi:hypothetical protein